MPVTTTLKYPKLPQIVTKLPGPKAKEIVERDHAVVSPSYTRDYPLVASGRPAARRSKTLTATLFSISKRGSL